MRRTRRHAVMTGIAFAVVVGTFLFVLPRIADYDAVWEVVRELEPIWIVVLLGAMLFNVLTYAPPWMLALPGLRFRQALPFTQASTALTYVAPGGGIVGMAGSFGLLRSWGFPSDAVARAVTITGVWNQLANLLLPVAAVFMLTAEAESGTVLTTLAIVGSSVFAVAVSLLTLALWSVRLARELGEAVAAAANRVLGLARRGPVGWGGESFARFRNQTVALILRRWWLLTLAAIVGNLAVFVMLLLAIRAVGIGAGELTWIEVFAGWSVARVIQLVPLTPGGLGPVEIGLTSVLVAFGGGNAEVVAAALVYRFLTIVPTLLLGLLTIAAWRRLAPDGKGQEIAPER